MSKLTINIDATALGSSGCILNLYRTVIGTLDDNGQSTGGYREKVMGSSLVYGIALHKFIDVMYKTGGVFPRARKAALESFDVPKKDNPKSMWLSDPKHLETACFNVWQDYISTDSTFELIELMQPCYLCRGLGMVAVPGIDIKDGGDPCPHCKGQKNLMAPATEITFSIKYYEDDTIIVYLCGTIDSIGKFKGGCYAIRDWKSTSSWDNEGYFQQYELSRQLRIYLLSLKLMALYHPDSTLGRLGDTTVGAFIDAIFLKTKANDVVCRRSEVFQIKQHDLDAFRLTLDDKLKQLSQAIKTGYLPKEGILNGSCEKKFGKCGFWDICRNDDAVGQILLNRQFKQQKFDPLKYNEV